MNMRAVIGILALMAFGPANATESELERVTDAPMPEKIIYVQAAAQEMRDAVDSVDGMIQSSMDGGAKAGTVDCLSVRFVQIEALSSVGDRSERIMVQAVGDGNIEIANHEFRKVVVAQQRSRGLFAEAERCVGGQELADGETVVVYVDPYGAVTWEVSWLSVPETDIGFDAPDVSPFL